MLVVLRCLGTGNGRLGIFAKGQLSTICNTKRSVGVVLRAVAITSKLISLVSALRVDERLAAENPQALI
jgi:hypothetical protein